MNIIAESRMFFKRLDKLPILLNYTSMIILFLQFIKFSCFCFFPAQPSIHNQVFWVVCLWSQRSCCQTLFYLPLFKFFFNHPLKFTNQLITKQPLFYIFTPSSTFEGRNWWWGRTKCLKIQFDKYRWWWWS